MNDQHPFPWTWEAKGNYSQIFDKHERLVASDMEVEQAKFIVECVNREHTFKQGLARPSYEPMPFVVETLQREGSCPRYRVSRHRGGGVYSDEFLDKKDADFMRHTLQREEAEKEQLRYRIWQLERALKEMCDEWEDVIPTHIYDGDEPENSEARQLLNRSRAVLNGDAK
jgi:hypothetical protein